MNDQSILPRPKKTPWKKIANLIKDYFVNSNEKLGAWLLLIGIVVCVVGIVALLAAMSWWSAAFWAILMAKTLSPFLICMGQFALLVGALVTAHVLKDYFIGKLAIRWRNWLTKKIMGDLFSRNNYLELRRIHPEIDNIGQRVQDDVHLFVQFTLMLGSDLLRSTLTLGAFIGTLWVVGGALSFALLGLNIVVPGYLVWVALLVAVVATVATHFLARSLAQKNKKAERLEADLRQDFELVNEESENIAEEHAQSYYQESIENKMQEITQTAQQKLNTQSRLIAFQNFNMLATDVIPYLASAPLYFVGLIELGQLMQVGMAFGQVTGSLSWFVDRYENIATYQSYIERILELKDAFENEIDSAATQSIHRSEKNKDILKIKELDIKRPHNKEVPDAPFIMRSLNLELKPQENVLIKGPSGLGKSTFFKAISGTWKYGSGKIRVPKGKNLYFLPQKPTIPKNSLMGVLAYPESERAYTKEQYIEALEAVGGMDEFIPRLAEVNLWSKELSGGQQQRISFARALLKKPDWLFLDEATSALDEASEHRVYSTLNRLPGATIISIAHRSTVEKYHSRVIFFNVNEDKQVELSEKTMENSMK